MTATNLSSLLIEIGNRLVLTHSERSEKHGKDKEDEYYNEVDSIDVVVAKYHVWDHMNIYPPQRTSQGWRKTDLAGTIIAEGSTRIK